MIRLVVVPPAGNQAGAAGVPRPGRRSGRAGYVGACALAGVGDGEDGSDGVTAFGLEIAAAEGGVAETVAEGVQRLLVLLGEPPVADLGALVVLDGDRGSPGGAQTGEVGRESDRQMWRGDLRAAVARSDQRKLRVR